MYLMCVSCSGNDFPVHPLDLTFVSTTEIPTADGTGSQNVTFCYNTYQYLTLDPDSFEGFDAVLGDEAGEVGGVFDAPRLFVRKGVLEEVAARDPRVK